MILNRLFPAAALTAGLALSCTTLAASPQLIVNQGQSNSCTVTPATGTVFTLDANGNVLVNGAYAAGGCSNSSSPADANGGGPTFSFNPNPADLTIANNSLTSAGGVVNPNFVAYFVNSCTGKVTQTAGCAAPSGAWGSGGTVCKGVTAANGQTYCSPASAPVTLPANPNATACVYTFQATNCTNGKSSVTSHTATVTVAAGQQQSSGCVVGGTSGELGAYGYSQQCAGTIHSLAAGLVPSWNNSYKSLMSGSDWPGNTAQYGKGITITVNATQWGSFHFNTGSIQGGVSFLANTSYGTLALMSVSTTPGDFFSGSAVCVGSNLTISSRTDTAASTNCKLQQNKDYYLNVSSASFTTPHDTTCSSSYCTTGWTVYSYGN